MVPDTMTYTVSHIRALPAPSIKKLLREAGYTLSDVAARRVVAPSLVSRVVRKQVTSLPVLEDIVHCLNHPRAKEAVA